MTKVRIINFFNKYSKKVPPDPFIPNFFKAVKVFEIAKPDWFFVQCCYESAFFTRRRENLNYTTLARLRAVFGSRIPKSDMQAKKLLRNPDGLANVVYKKFLTGEATTNRKLTGSDMVGEDWLQLTGEHNKQEFKAQTGIDCWANKHWFSQPKNSFMASGFYWALKEIDFCLSFKDATRKITGKSLIGYNRRVSLLKNLYMLYWSPNRFEK